MKTVLCHKIGPRNRSSQRGLSHRICKASRLFRSVVLCQWETRKRFVITLLGCHPHCSIVSAPIIAITVIRLIPFGVGLVGVLSMSNPQL